MPFRSSTAVWIKPIFGLSVWSIGLFLIAFLTSGRRITIDDADIFFTYAQNLAEGNGVTYSSGIPRVEGYTSTLWMLISAAIFRIGFDEVGIWLISVILFISTHFIAFRIIEYSIQEPSWTRAKITYLLGVSLSFGYVSWMLLPLMDTTLWGFALMSLCYILIMPQISNQSKTLGIIVFTLIPLIRPEAIFIVPLLFFGIVFIKRSWLDKILLRFFVSFLFSSIALTLFRILYFGYPFPNTYYAKVSTSVVENVGSGVTYIMKYFQSSLIGLLAFGSVVIWLFTLIKRKYFSRNLNFNPLVGVIRIRSFTVVSLLVASFFAVTVLSGGDHFNLFRILQPITPLLILAIALIISNLVVVYPNLTRGAYTFGIALLFVFSEIQATGAGQSLSSTIALQRSPIAHEFQIAQNGRYWGLALNNIFRESERFPNVGTIAAGGFARTYQGTIYDLMGLNNVEMAHDSTDRSGYRNHAIFDKEIFFKWPVEIVLSAPEIWSMNVALKGLAKDARFSNKFTYGCLTNLNFPKSGICAYYSKSLLQGLDGLEFKFEVGSAASRDIVGPISNN